MTFPPPLVITVATGIVGPPGPQGPPAPNPGAATYYLLDATGGAQTVNLPSPTSLQNQGLTYVKVDSTTNVITLARIAAVTINGIAGNMQLQSQWDSVTIVSTGTNWVVVNAQIAPMFRTSSGSWIVPVPGWYRRIVISPGTGGAGGGAAALTGGVTNQVGGNGGASGGYSEDLQYYAQATAVSCTIGAGVNGGLGGAASTGAAGSTGASSGTSAQSFVSAATNTTLGNSVIGLLAGGNASSTILTPANSNVTAKGTPSSSAIYPTGWDSTNTAWAQIAAGANGYGFWPMYGGGGAGFRGNSPGPYSNPGGAPLGMLPMGGPSGGAATATVGGGASASQNTFNGQAPAGIAPGASTNGLNGMNGYNAVAYGYGGAGGGGGAPGGAGGNGGQGGPGVVIFVLSGI